MNKIENETICVVANLIIQQLGSFCNNIDRMFNYYKVQKILFSTDMYVAKYRIYIFFIKFPSNFLINPSIFNGCNELSYSNAMVIVNFF